MIPKWLSDTITAFGRRFGLEHFALGASGVAAVQFEDGTRFALECANGHVYVLVEIPCAEPSLETLQALLLEAHPLRGGDYPVRTAYRARQGLLLLVTALREDQVDETTLEAVFEDLWNRREHVRRTLWA